MTAEDPDFHRRDLRESIQRGEFPVWRLEMQIMPFRDADTYRFNPFDLTKVWPHGDYRPITIGRMVLDRNPENFFAQIEQSAFEPANMVPGIGPSPDKMLLGRLFSYADTHRYRIGTNYLQLPVNAPQNEVHSYNKDGAMRYHYPVNQPVYAPNSYGGPRADPVRYPDPGWFTSGEIMRSAYTPRAEDNDFGQPGTLYRKVLSATERDHLVSNIVTHMSAGVERFIQERTVKDYWSKVDPDLGARVAQGLGLDVSGLVSV